MTDLESTNGTYVNEKRIADGCSSTTATRSAIGDAVLKFVVNHLEVDYTRQVSTLASVDALTGALGKLHFDAALVTAVERASRSSHVRFVLCSSTSITSSAVNDTYGHPAGDAVLARLAAIVRGLLGPEPPFGRVGGEEFAITLGNTPLGAARVLAERIRMTVERTTFDHLGRTIAVTLSLGVAELSAGESAEAALSSRRRAALRRQTCRSQSRGVSLIP